jgi:hypothetical protein
MVIPSTAMATALVAYGKPLQFMEVQVPGEIDRMRAHREIKPAISFTQ